MNVSVVVGVLSFLKVYVWWEGKKKEEEEKGIFLF